ncbi:MAG: Spy/CpxP family protein refolding chaperone [Smithella sp.]
MKVNPQKRRGLILLLILSLTINATAVMTVGYHYFQNKCFISSRQPCLLKQTSNHLYKSLGLTQAQLETMTPLSHTFQSRITKLEAAIKNKRSSLVDKLERNDISQVEVLRLEIAVLQQEMHKEVISHILETGKILNPEQKKQFFILLKSSISNGGPGLTFPVGGNQ